MDILLPAAHNDSTDAEVRAAVLGLISVMASGHEKADDDDDGVKAPAPPPNVLLQYR